MCSQTASQWWQESTSCLTRYGRKCVEIRISFRISVLKLKSFRMSGFLFLQDTYLFKCCCETDSSKRRYASISLQYSAFWTCGTVLHRASKGKHGQMNLKQFKEKNHMCIGTVRLIFHVLAELHRKINTHICLYVYLTRTVKTQLSLVFSWFITAVTRGVFFCFMVFSNGFVTRLFKSHSVARMHFCY